LLCYYNLVVTSTRTRQCAIVVIVCILFVVYVCNNCQFTLNEVCLNTVCS